MQHLVLLNSSDTFPEVMWRKYYKIISLFYITYIHEKFSFYDYFTVYFLFIVFQVYTDVESKFFTQYNVT